MKTITRDELVSILNYDPETGIFTWKKPYGTRVRAGSVAGTLGANGYIRIKINGSKFQAHRLAMLYVHGTLPPADTDHINRLKSDNRIVNHKLPELDGDKQVISFLHEAVVSMVVRMEYGDFESALSMGKACLIGVDHGTNSIEFKTHLAIEFARLRSMNSGQL